VEVSSSRGGSPLPLSQEAAVSADEPSGRFSQHSSQDCAPGVEAEDVFSELDDDAAPAAEKRKEGSPLKSEKSSKTSLPGAPAMSSPSESRRAAGMSSETDEGDEHGVGACEDMPEGRTPETVASEEATEDGEAAADDPEKEAGSVRQEPTQSVSHGIAESVPVGIEEVAPSPTLSEDADFEAPEADSTGGGEEAGGEVEGEAAQPRELPSSTLEFDARISPARHTQLLAQALREGAGSAGLSEASDASVVDLLAGYQPAEEPLSPVPMGDEAEQLVMDDEAPLHPTPERRKVRGGDEGAKRLECYCLLVAACCRLSSLGVHNIDHTLQFPHPLPQLKKQGSVIGEVGEADEWI
jgi:hypothetical protein